MKKRLLSLLPIVLLFCVTPAFSPAAPDATPKEAALDTRAIYSVQFRLIPSLLLDNKYEGLLFTGLHSDDPAAREKAIVSLNKGIISMLGEDYAKNIRYKTRKNPDIVFISFPEPPRPPLCYHVALIKNPAGGFLYLTLEKAADLFDTGMKSVMGGQTLEQHSNFGPRNYSDLDSFEKDVLKYVQNTAGGK